MKLISFVEHVFASYPIIKTIVTDLEKSGAIPLLVGGAVRDFFLSQETKDFDIEVYHMPEKKLEEILKKYGPVNEVGKSFGVFKLHPFPIDWSLPRKDSSGRKPHVEINEHLSFREAFIRRDLTMNAMGVNLITRELIDPFNGKIDLEHKMLRTPDTTFFIQDPLRFYRVMQFIGRFDMYPDEKLITICKTMDISNVSQERISEEFEKMFLKSTRPSLGFRWLRDIGRLKEIIPEIDTLIGLKQNPLFHPEGDVFEHSMQTLDAAKKISDSYEKKEDKLILLYATFCHDCGKKGGDTDYGHEIRGAELVKKIMPRLTISDRYTLLVQKLVRYHMMPGQLVTQNSSMSAYKRLSAHLAPELTLKTLADLATADRQGRNPESSLPLSSHNSEIEEFKKKAKEAAVFHESEKPLLQGRDLLEVVKPGKELGTLLKEAYEIQIQEEIKNKEELRERIIKKTKK